MKDYSKELTGEQKIIIAFTDPLNKQIEKLTIENAKLKLQLLQTDVSGSTCPKCGCQINDPFTGTAIIHDVQACGGIIR